MTSPFYLPYYFVGVIAFLAVCALRYVLVLILGAIFPFTIFLFFFDWTRSVGAKLMRYTLMAIFVPVLQAIFLIISLNGVASIGTTDPWSNMAAVGVALAGIALIIISPLIMLGIMKWIGGLLVGLSFAFSSIFAHTGGLLKHIPTTGVLLGGLMMGEGHGAVSLAATFMFLHELEHRSEAVAKKRLEQLSERETR